MDEKTLILREAFANHEMAELYNKTRKLYEKYSFEVAEIYLQTQLNFLRDMREVDEMIEKDFGGDENGF